VWNFDRKQQQILLATRVGKMILKIDGVITPFSYIANRQETPAKVCDNHKLFLVQGFGRVNQVTLFNLHRVNHLMAHLLPVI
jgi:hypothetical protein